VNQLSVCACIYSEINMDIVYLIYLVIHKLVSIFVFGSEVEFYISGQWLVEEGREFRFRGDLYSQESTFPLVSP